jgi:hypothetical protein
VRASFPLANLSTAERPELPDHFPLPFTSTDVPPRDVPYGELPAPQDLPPYANQMTQHPPLYYLLLAGQSRVVPGFGGWSFPAQLGVLRLLSALLLLPLPALAARPRGASVRHRRSPRRPRCCRSRSRSWRTSGRASTTTCCSCCSAPPSPSRCSREPRGRVAAHRRLVGVLLGLALLTKAWAVGLLAWAGLAYLLALLGRRAPSAAAPSCPGCWPPRSRWSSAAGGGWPTSCASAPCSRRGSRRSPRATPTPTRSPSSSACCGG